MRKTNMGLGVKEMPVKQIRNFVTCILSISSQKDKNVK